MSDSIIESLRHHAQDDRNTAFARSTMREAELEIEQQRLADEGAKEAFAHVVQQKRDLETECKRLGGLLDGAYKIIRQKERELAASRHELEGAKKAADAQARLIDSLEQQRTHLHAQRDKWIEARNTLDSERAANARLTDELAASREREARMRDAAEQVIEMNRQHAKAMFGFSEKADSYPMVICLRDALAEGAQGANHG